MKRKIMKIVTIILTLAMTISVSGCANGAKTTDDTDSDNSQDKDGKIKIVTSIFPEYDWVREILGDNLDSVDLVLLQKEGTDMHSFQPSVQDIADVSDCDLFIYTGGVSDEWASSAMANATNKDMKVINVMDVLGDDVKDEEIIEGMQDDHDHEDEDEHDHEDEDEDDHDHEDEDDSHTHEADEHVWLSLRNAEKICKAIDEAISEIDKDEKDQYTESTNNYIKKLSDLDEQYSSMVKSSKGDTIVFGDRFPFRYLVDDYDIDYYAAFAGCSAETEASFETIVFLSDKINEFESKDIMVLENSDQKVAESIKDNTTTKDQNIVVLNSMQSVKSSDIENGVTYLSIMEENYDTLKEVLNH
ncbi:MAG: metal ABC transporter substrate-binding protein [Suipraeoptans sp.]